MHSIALLFRTTVAVMAISAPGILERPAEGDQSTGAARDEDRHVLVLPGIGDMRVSVGSKARRGVLGASATMTGDGTMRIRGRRPELFEWNASKIHNEEVVVQLTNRETEDFFADVVATVNGFYFIIPDGRSPVEHHGARFSFRVEAGWRAVTVEMEQTQPGRMNLQSGIGRISNAIDDAMEQSGWTRKGARQFPKPFDLDARYHDARVYSHRTVFPRDFDEWDGVGISIWSPSERREVVFFNSATPGNARSSQLTVLTEVRDTTRPGVRRQEDALEVVSAKDRETFETCAKTIIEGFTLDGRRKAESGDQVKAIIEVSLSSEHRAISVEFSSQDEDIPPQWRDLLGNVFESANAILSPEHKKIEWPPALP
ncbi:MAG: hypothetical protein ACKV0T_07685 [Planctomycetales bacterium]